MSPLMLDEVKGIFASLICCGHINPAHPIRLNVHIYVSVLPTRQTPPKNKQLSVPIIFVDILVYPLHDPLADYMQPK